ncbi:uncharacterized protein LOC120301719 isoform X2 [Crotalus tigris]|uniref:uncharacterized protein LOC120301719 isoform X2 n=1 Tax=Crotalus tigris TaxID=88082 RepID=UPI00192F52B6|nr:uncharacterized protein LOC120301719 isoform X2 [Crotalus tigris]
MVAAAEELRDGLRSATRVLHEQHRGWLEALAACLPLLRALGNLARQAEATQRAPLAETPLRAFARLPERLRLKQRAAMEALLAELRREKLPALREARDAVGARVAPLLALGGPHPNPAWADLLAGLLDAEALFHAVYPSPGRGRERHAGGEAADCPGALLNRPGQLPGGAAAAALAQLPGPGGGAGGPPRLGADPAARAARRPRGRDIAKSRLLPGGHMRA